MVMYSAGWCAGELLDRSVRGACGEVPVIASIEGAGSGIEAEGDRDSVFENKRGSRGWNGNEAG